MNTVKLSVLASLMLAGTLAAGAEPEPALPPAPRPPARPAAPARTPVPATPARSDASVWLGILFGDALDGGVQVVAVVPGGPADVAGVRNGDVLLAFDEKAVPDRSALVSVVQTLHPNEEVSVRLVRQGRPGQAAMRPLAASVRNKTLLERIPVEIPDSVWGIAGESSAFAGCETTRITRDLRLHFGAPADAGVLVVRVDSDSAAAKAGLAVGDVVVKMADLPIEDPDDMIRVIVRADSGSVPIEVMRARKKVVLRVEKIGPDLAARDAERARLEAEQARLRRELERVQIEIEKEETVAVIAAVLAASLLLADLPDETLSKLKGISADASATEVLARVREVDGAVPFDRDALRLSADRRWWASEPGDTAGAPLLELRRWPGDTVIAVYAVPESASPPVARGSWRAAAAPDGERRFEGKIETDQGVHDAIWCERRIADSPSRLAALLSPGDGGLGADGLAASRAALVDLWQRMTADPEPWAAIAPLAQGRNVDLPDLGPEPRDGDERSDPWRTVTVTGFSIGLPPGLRASRTDGDLTPPRPVDGSVLWLRGRFKDRNGAAVVVGDGLRNGYIALVDASPEWFGGTIAPRGSPRASRVDALPLDEIVVSDTVARAGRVERWTEAGWGGSWLVFRLTFETGRGLEIALPVEGAWRSLALFWIPATIRPDGYPAAPPPIDAAERIGIRFERLRGAERQRSPLTEGWLVAPGLRVALPRGWYPVVAIRTADGFPISIYEDSGALAGTIRRLRATDAAALTVDPASGWSSIPRPGVHSAAAVYAKPDGGRLFVAREGNGFAFEPAAEEGSAPQAWVQFVGSVGLSKAKKGPGASPDYS